MQPNQKLTDLRNEARLSQEGLAGIIGISQSMIARIETGERDPGTGIKIKLARYFKVSVERLFYEQLYDQQPYNAPTGTDND